MRGRPPPTFREVEPLVPILISVLQTNDDSAKTDAFWGLSYIADTVTGDHRGLFTPALFEGLRKQLAPDPQSQPLPLLTPAIRLAGNIASGPDSVVDKFSGCLAPYVQHLYHASPNLKETLWGFSNITAGSSAQIDAVVHMGCIPRVVELVSGPWPDVAKEGLWALANACSGCTKSTRSKLVGLGVLDAFLFGLGMVSDPKALAVALKGLSTMETLSDSCKKEPLLAALKPLLRHPQHGAKALQIFEALGGSVEEEQ